MAAGLCLPVSSALHGVGPSSPSAGPHSHRPFGFDMSSQFESFYSRMVMEDAMLKSPDRGGLGTVAMRSRLGAGSPTASRRASPTQGSLGGGVAKRSLWNLGGGGASPTASASTGGQQGYDQQQLHRGGGTDPQEASTSSAALSLPAPQRAPSGGLPPLPPSHKRCMTSPGGLTRSVCPSYQPQPQFAGIPWPRSSSGLSVLGFEEQLQPGQADAAVPLSPFPYLENAPAAGGRPRGMLLPLPRAVGSCEMDVDGTAP